MRLLADQHHADLLYAIQRTFEDRLGYDVFVPKGHEWWDAGYWRFGEVYGDDRLAAQFLAVNESYTEVEPGLWLTFDPGHPDRPIYGASLERAAGWSWDAVLCTVQENQAGFARFADERAASYLYHVGNANQEIDRSLSPIVIDGPQEFDHLTTFRFREPVRRDRVTSFVNLLPLIPEAWRPFEGLAARTGMEFRSFGHACPSGNLHPVARIADEMARAGWAYHDKVTGDGFGHIIHNWAAVGRPLIGHASYYAGQRAEPLWVDGETCIDLDRHSLDEAAEIILGTTEARHAEMCRAIRTAFDAIYDPAAEADRIRALL